MKIYSARNIASDLSYFAGKDIWVKCYIKDEGYNAYIRPIECRWGKWNTRFIVYNFVPEYTIDDHDLEMLTKQEVLESVKYEYFGDLGNFEILQPLDTLTTQEIIDEINECPDTPF